MVLPEGCNTEWVVSQLDKFIRITDGKFVSGPGGEFDPMWDSDFDRDEMGMRTNSWTESVRLGVRECQATRTSRSAWPSTWSRSAADR